MGEIARVCVYCGSSPGNDPDLMRAATRFGEILADNGVGLVYGGGASGLMGAIASAVQARGGEIIGIIPEFLTERENMFSGAHELVVTRDMHERKRMMFERSDAFVALPGGIGTLEETVEQLTWAQLGRHQKPILLANLKGFWDSLIDVFGHMGRLGFIHSAAKLTYLVTDNVEDILPALRAAAAQLSEEEKAGEPETVRRL
ncbi:MAG TPA: TIGR00730 family Rossman fold protein [Xanthobacteraceae bacterium]|jgi:hypothetical protein|nr:TIGR00730 family Rossman fold protein [Xanthobacteraceae bacterium]